MGPGVFYDEQFPGALASLPLDAWRFDAFLASPSLLPHLHRPSCLKGEEKGRRKGVGSLFLTAPRIVFVRRSAMPRRPRLAAGDLAYHVLNRRVGRLPLFEKAPDYLAFETIWLKRMLARASGLPPNVSCPITGISSSGLGRMANSPRSCAGSP